VNSSNPKFRIATLKAAVTPASSPTWSVPFGEGHSVL
jgi:hypothetical protein